MDTPDPYRPPEGHVADFVPDHESATPLADRLPRLLARFVDGLIVLVPMLLLMFAFGGLGGDEPSLGMIYLLAFIPAFIAFLVNLYFLAENGQTMGKKAIGIKIVRLDRTKASLGRIVLFRMIAPGVIGMVPLVGFIFALANILFIFREDRRCVHDWMADTVVVKA